MNEVKEKISTLIKEEKEKLFEYLKRIINNEFKFEKPEIYSHHKCNSTSIVKLGKYNNMQN